jgi:hypothetical protein
MISYEEWAKKKDEQILEAYMYKGSSFADTLSGPDDQGMVVPELYKTLAAAYPFLNFHLDLRGTILVLDALMNGDETNAARTLHDKGAVAKSTTGESHEPGVQWDTYWTGGRGIPHSWTGGQKMTPTLPKPHVNQNELKQLHRWAKDQFNRHGR